MHTRPRVRQFLRALAVTLLAAWPAAQAAAARDIPVPGPGALPEALAAATAGDRLLLEGGDYGPLVMTPKSGLPLEFPRQVTVASADPETPASFSKLALNGVSNLTFDGIVFDYTYTAGDPDNLQAFRVVNCAGVTIRNSVFDGDVARGVSESADGVGYAYGLWIRASSDITIENNEIFEFRRGIISSYVDGLTVRGNDLHSMGGDGMNFAQVQHVLVEGNHIHDFARNATASIHPDMIQFWTAGTGKPSSDIIIRGNLLSSGDGPWTQSIFMRNELVDSGKAGDEMFYRNVVIAGNLIINAHLHGITIGETEGLSIHNNTLVRNPASAGKKKNYALWTPTIRIAARSRNVGVRANVTAGIEGQKDQGDWTVQDNLIVQDRSRLRPNFYGLVFAGHDPTDPASFAPRPGGPLDGTGIGATLPALP